jgi:hypothetical protein
MLGCRQLERPTAEFRLQRHAQNDQQQHDRQRLMERQAKQGEHHQNGEREVDGYDDGERNEDERPPVPPSAAKSSSGDTVRLVGRNTRSLATASGAIVSVPPSRI